MAVIVRALSLASLLCASLAMAQAPYDAVNPFIGTAADGNTFPGATLPFGMIQWGPDTRADGWYRSEDKSIRGFSLTHISGAGCPIYADVPILPWLGAVARSPVRATGRTLPLSHDREQAHPGYYAISFPNGIKVELTTTARAGIGRFTFPAGARRSLLFDAGASATSGNAKRKNDSASIRLRGNGIVSGVVHSGGFCESNSNYTLYFVARFARPFSRFGAWGSRVEPGAASASGHDAGVYVSFRSGTEPILMKVAVSFVSLANAEANLAAEIPGWDFDAVHTQAKAAWTEMFDRLRVEGGTADQRTIFYTGLYHMLLSPNLFSDANGEYRGFDGRVHRLAAGHSQYANFSDWDTYRNAIHLHALLAPQTAGDMMQSLVFDAEQSGWLPRWPVANDVSYVMGGDSSAILLSSAHAFGARSFDTASALRSMIKGATQPGIGPHGKRERPGLADYLRLGYVPMGGEAGETAASVTLEYASADFAVSSFAAAMGDDATAAKLLRSSGNWRNLFYTETKFIRPRMSDGTFMGGFDPDRLLPHFANWDKSNQLGFEEGSTWQYTWMIPHNYAGLFRAMGGNQAVLPRLDRFFEKVVGWGTPNFTVANEPDFVAPYAYIWAGAPWKAQEVIDRIRREAFNASPGGLPGNDDLGATSGVYVWGALGMYPVIPGVGAVALGTPLFPSATMRMGDGKVLEIVATGEGIYVQSVTFNGRPYQSAWLPLDRLTPGGNRLEFALGPQPNREWASQVENLPPSFGAPQR
jgi:predicted alpha-1,2-mannosidase